VHVVTLPVDPKGLIDLNDLRAAISPEKSLVAVQWANNETGVIQPIKEASEIVRAAGGWLHCDAVQAAGKVPITFEELGVDSMAISAHKLHGPGGIGALILNPTRQLPSLLPSGDQERGIRPGTHHLAGAVGFGVASMLRTSAWEEEVDQMRRTRDLFERLALESGAVETVNGSSSLRLPNTTNLRFDRVEGDALVARLDIEGVLCSQSSACTAMRPEPSFVLRAMGLSEEQSFRSVRFSTSSFTTEVEATGAATTLGRVCEMLRGSPFNRMEI
jgi:cysteine desulfurase